MLKFNERSRTLVSILIFVLIFAALMLVASFLDLQISDILTNKALPDGEYLANDFFGVTGEMFGTSPVYLIAALCTTILFWYFLKVWKLKPLRTILAVIFFAAGTVAFWFFIKDIISYILEHAGAEAYAYRHASAVAGAEVLTAIVMNVMAILAGKNLKEETLRKLGKFVLAVLIGAVIANLVVMIVKDPMGRMRYRAMNSSGDFSGYTAWYVANGKRVPTAEEMARFGWAKDAFKSFPSGHTCAAGMLYALMILPDVLDIKNKGAKFACWGLPIIFTGMVAISRIMVGAHFMSDVTMGGTIAFLSMMLGREIAVCKLSHFKALFGKAKPKELTDEITA